MESDYDSLFNSEDETLHSGSDSEIDAMSEEESSDDDTFALARQWFRIQQDTSSLSSFVLIEVLDIKNIDVSELWLPKFLRVFFFFFDKQSIERIANKTNRYAKSAYYARGRKKTSRYETQIEMKLKYF